ncbi:MAG: hypothetical protein IT288_03610 [Bdellovibrionales bacterium]|nr:hypothetical protein [Bdellovibrionales bacterium]
MGWRKVVSLQWIVWALVASGSAGGQPDELLKQICAREERLGHLAVACYILGRGREWDCHPVYLRRTSIKELRKGYRLPQMPKACRARIISELERRRYLRPSQAQVADFGLSDLLLEQPPNLWQEN